MKILYLEDDINLSVTITEFLEDNGYEVKAVYDSNEVLDELYSNKFDLLILDVNVPGINGFELLKSLRDSSDTTPAIFTTSLNSIDDLSKGYEVGADDYIKKPFLLKELLLRVKALLKREYKADTNIINLYQNISFNLDTRVISVDSIEHTLNQKENELLKLLIKHRGQCVEFETIFESVWNYDETHSDQSLRTYIKNLRKYIGKDSIKSIKKRGYILV
jgi:DNA-binding response OmpR family regulator